MPKTTDARLDATLDQILDPEWQVSLFAGFNEATVRRIIIADFNNHWTDAEQIELGTLLSLGGVRILKIHAG